jgi:hypothetical protein
MSTSFMKLLLILYDNLQFKDIKRVTLDLAPKLSVTKD